MNYISRVHILRILQPCAASRHRTSDPLSLSFKWPLQLTTNMTFFEHPSALSISPHAGPVTGETLINVSGSNFPETGTTLCRMDNHVSAGSRLDDTTVLCISPTLHATSERHIVAHNFSYVPAESVLLGSAGVESGQLSLGAFNASGSLIFEADTPRGSHPHVPFFELSFQVSAPALSLPEIHALVGDRVEYEPREPRLQGAVPVDRLQYQPAPPMLEIKQRSWSPLDGSVTSYSLSFGDLYANAPTGAGGAAFGGKGVGRGLSVRFGLATARFVPLILGNGCNETYMKPSCERRIIRSDTIEVLYDRERLAIAEIGRNLSHHGWSDVEIRVEQDSTVAVAVRGIEYLSGIKLPVGHRHHDGCLGSALSTFRPRIPRERVLFDNTRVSSGYLHPNHQPAAPELQRSAVHGSPRIRILPASHTVGGLAEQRTNIRPHADCTARRSLWHWLSEVLSLWQPHGRRKSDAIAVRSLAFVHVCALHSARVECVQPKA